MQYGKSHTQIMFLPMCRKIVTFVKKATLTNSLLYLEGTSLYENILDVFSCNESVLDDKHLMITTK